jgi:carboxypeptidase family protein
MTYLRLTLACALWAAVCFGQNAQVSGSIRDPSSLTVSGADVRILNEQTGGRRNTRSNESGFYSLPSLAPGNYRITIRVTGFETMVREGIKLEVGDNARLDFELKVHRRPHLRRRQTGSAVRVLRGVSPWTPGTHIPIIPEQEARAVGDSQTVITVHGGPPLINTEDASVGTVIDRDIIDQMPLNGRGIQTLIELSPGVVATPVVTASPGQFVVNGQRNDTGYFTVDGVSANFAALGSVSLLPTGVQTVSPAIPASNFLGTFSNLVSPDALQEFRIQTSTFAPEFGHSPGAQIGMITRSGTNRYTGSLFEYLRNYRMDPSDWFANAFGAGKPPLRFNNFGGTLGGPLSIPHLYNGHDRTFLFASVESLVAVQPQPSVANLVPTLAARQNAPPLVAALLSAYPLPNRSYGPDGDPEVSGIAESVGSYSLPLDQQTYALRLDQIISDRVTFFARYSRAPAASSSAPSGDVLTHNTIGTQTVTVGSTHILTPHMVNDSLNLLDHLILGFIRPIPATTSR